MFARAWSILARVQAAAVHSLARAEFLRFKALFRVSERLGYLATGPGSSTLSPHRRLTTGRTNDNDSRRVTLMKGGFFFPRGPLTEGTR